MHILFNGLVTSHMQSATIAGSCTVIGHGRVGKAVSKALTAAWGVEPTVVGRGGIVPADRQGPIYVCTTNDALHDVITRCVPRARHADLVLLQNGMIHPLLDFAHLSPPGCEEEGQQRTSRDNVSITQVLLYASADDAGRMADGKRTVAAGRWAQHAAKTLGAGAVSCRPVGGAELQAACVEKTLWASIFWLLSSALGGMRVGKIVEQHRQDVEGLAQELLPLAAGFLERRASESAWEGSRAMYAQGAALLQAPAARAAVVQGLVAYSMAIEAAVPSRAMAMSELAWRNAFFLACLAADRRDKFSGSGRGTSLICSPQVECDKADVDRGVRGEVQTVPGGLCVNGMALRDVADWLCLDVQSVTCSGHRQTLHEAWLVRAGLQAGQVRRALTA